MLARTRMFASLFLLGLVIRSIGYPTVFSSAGVQLPYAGDAYYHLRRIWFSVARFPESLPFDLYVSFPEGSRIIWPPAFDWAIAALIYPFVDSGDQHAVEAIAVWVPAVLGAATTGLVGVVGARLYGRSAGWCAGLIYSPLPISFTFSQLGMIDHHIAIAFLSALLLWLSCEIFAREDRSADWASALVAPSTRLTAALGLLMAITMLTWPGALLHLSLLQLVFCIRWLFTKNRETARTLAVSFVVGQVILAACVAPFTMGTVWKDYGTWTPMVLSNLQPAYFACAAITVVLAQLLHEHSPFGESRGRRILSSLALAALGLLAALLALPAMREALLYASGWFTGGEEISVVVNEMQPILATNGRFDSSFAVQMFGAGILVLPLIWLYLACRARRERSVPAGLLLFLSAAFIILTLQQWRFGNTLAVTYAILLGAGLAEWLARLRHRLFERPLRPVLEAIIVCALVAWSLHGFNSFYRATFLKNFRALSDERVRVAGPLRPVVKIYDEAGRWIRENTPRTSGYLDPAHVPEYAVMPKWSYGHLMRYRAERPMVLDNFGPYAGRDIFEAATTYFDANDEDSAVEILEKLGVRYVVGGPSGSGSHRKLKADSMAARLGRAFGSFARFPNQPITEGLGRHRLIFYAHSGPANVRRQRLFVSLPHESLGVWEIVRGARIEGRTKAGASVRLSLTLATEAGWPSSYRRRVRADTHGLYRIVVPYPTDTSFSPNIHVQGHYHIQADSAEGELAVSEAEVRSGAVVQGPDL